MVTATSGYHLKATIKNTSNDALAAGTFTVSVNDYYTFASRLDLQQWAQGDSRIQVPNQLGQVPVPQIGKGEKVSVSVDMNPDQPSLKNMLSWGPKPVRIDYSFPGNAIRSDGTKSDTQTTYVNTTHTFLTRSGDGLNTANTPPMNITMVMPLTGDNWQVDNDKLNTFMTTGDSDVAKTPATTNGTTQSGNDNSAGADAVVNSLLTNTAGNGTDKKTSSTHKLSQSAEQLVTKHPGLQIIADPTLAQNLVVPPKSAAIMQPGNFDMTTYTALNDESSYEKAGVAIKSWTADASIRQYRKALGDQNANLPAYAWPGRGQWTMDSLQMAKQQGYSTVIAPEPGSTADSTNSTIRTGKYTIHTSAGDVTVLTAQDELSRLAEGKATDKSVDGESSAAGRLARFMAQSAFYQMESPYATRNLLVCFDTSTVNSESNAQEADTLMQTLEQAPWLSLRNLSELDQAKPYFSGQRAARMVPSSSDIHASTLRLIKQALSTLATSKKDIDRFNTSILDESSANTGNASGDSKGSGTSGTSGSARTPDGSGTNTGANGQSGQHGSTSGTSSNSGAGSDANSKADNTSGKSDNSSTSGASGTNGNVQKQGNTPGNLANNNGANSKTDTGDTQALARQDADATAKRSKDGCDWIDTVTSLHNAIALHALSANDALAKNMSASAQNLANQLMNGITITPSESITVLSESAKMPVTVSNNHPYPVTVKISSLSDSMEIVTTRFATLSVPARSEAQTTFNVRVSTSGTATAHLTLTDRKGDTFSTPQSTRITSTLRLSDMSGIIFIAIALVLGALGLWRQFNRKKDPDE